MLNPEILVPAGLAAASVGSLWAGGRLVNFALRMPAAEADAAGATSASRGSRRGSRAGARSSECLALPGHAVD